MNLSYWEIKSWFSNVDFTIVGSGIVGLNTALYLKKKYPKARILVLEKGSLPQGASTKNAGFACFGSISEILDDLNSHSEQEVLDLINKRWKGLALLRRNLGDVAIDYQQHGGYELFNEDDGLFEQCASKIAEINTFIAPVFKKKVFSRLANTFNFSNIKNEYIFNALEGQIDTGKMLLSLLKLVHSNDVRILNNCTVTNFSENKGNVKVATNLASFNTGKLFITTNGFAKNLLEIDVKPARAQVLITKPIENLAIKGTFHIEKGYYYFRNIDNRILFGGGRNLDFKAEETTEFGQTKVIQNKLEQLLNQTILPNYKVEIEHRWSGIMGVGAQKKSIVKQLSNHVFCGVRLGGMGVAVGSLVGKELADLNV